MAKYKRIDDEGSALTFQMVTGVSFDIDEVAEAEWNELHDIRREVRKAAKELNKRTKSENVTEDDSVAVEFCREALSFLKEEFEERESLGVKGPIDRRAPTEKESGTVLYTPDGEVINRATADVKDRTFRSLFLEGRNERLDNGGFRSLNEFMSVALSGRYDPRLEGCIYRSQLEGIAAQGGYAVPMEYSEKLFDGTIENSIVMSRAVIEPMISRQKSIAAFDSANHSSSLYGGFTKTWTGEGGTANVQTASLRNIVLTADKLILRTNASREVLDDSPMFRSRLTTAMQTATSAFLDEDFLTGDGVAKPLGVVNNPSIISVNRTTANTVVYADLRAVYSRLHPAFHKNAVWLVSPDMVPELMAVVDTNNNLIWNPGRFGSIKDAVPSTLFGIEVIISEKIGPLGSKGDITLVDLSQYVVGLRQDFIIESSNAVNFASDLTDFRIVVRATGQGLWDKVITPMNGGATLSWAVVLDTP